MKYKRYIIFILPVISLLYLSCNNDSKCDCLKSTGDITSEVRTISGFNKISIEDNINLYITEDTTFSLTVQAGSHLMSFIKTYVTDSCLYLQNKNKCNWLRSFKDKVNVYLKCKEIKSMNYSEASGNIISTDTLHSGFFQLDDWDGSGTIDLTIAGHTTWFNLHTGPADLTVRGTTGVNYLYSAGNGKADLQHLSTAYTFITNTSTNNCYINVENELDANIFSIGDIYYTGTPSSITTDITGSGHLIHQ